MTVQHWNEGDLWRTSYDGLADGFLFFAEDVFGCQFAFDSDRIGGVIRSRNRVVLTSWRLTWRVGRIGS